MTLASGEVEDVALEADCLVCTGCVMARADDGSVRAVPAFASGWLTAQRPCAHVMRLREEDVSGVEVEGLLAAVRDDVAGVAAGVGGSGLVEVNGAGRLFGMHQLLQKAVRAEVGDAHDGVMAALLEARCGCMGDEDRIDHRFYGVVREVVGAAGHVLGRMKAAAAHRAAWVCGMRVRVFQLAELVMGAQSLEALAYYDALDADLSALGVEEGRPVAAE